MITIQVNQQGDFTLPPDLKQRYNIQAGDTFYLADLDGVLILSPQKPLVPALTAEIEQARLEAGLSIDDLLQSLREQREKYVSDKYDL